MIKIETDTTHTLYGWRASYDPEPPLRIRPGFGTNPKAALEALMQNVLASFEAAGQKMEKQ